MFQKYFKALFWFGYAATVLTAFLPLGGNLSGEKIVDFRLDHLLKFAVAVLLLATITELVQLWVPARAFNPFDLLANVTGVAAGVGVIMIWGRGQRHQQ